MVNLSFAINYAFGETRVWGYHAFNLAVHILAGLTLFGLVRRTLLRPILRERFGASATLLALTVAAIWMLHPLQTESVTYTVQRAESLMGLFYLLTVYCFIRGSENRDEEAGNRTPKAGGQNPETIRTLSSGLSPLVSRLWLPASVFFCFLGMATKEVMVSAPVMAMLYDRTFMAGSFREAWRKHRHLYLGLAASWLLLGYLVASTGGNRNGSAGFDSGMSWWMYARIQLEAIVHYLWLSLWPHPLVFDYGTAVVKQATKVIPYALVIIAMATGTVVALRRWPAIGFSGVWFFAILAPSSSVVPVVTETMAEQRMYLPLAAVIALLALGIYAWAGRFGTFVLLAFAVLLGFFTLRRNEDYGSAVSIWSDTVSKCPENFGAHNSLGNALFDAGRKTEAVQQYRESMRLKPTDPNSHHDLAAALLNMDQAQEAVRQFHETLWLNPGQSNACDGYGLALIKLGQVAKAIEEYKEALRLNPDYAEAHNNLGVAFGQTGQMPEAIAQFKEALRLNPNYAEAYNDLGYAYRQTGLLEAALAQFQLALQSNPDFDEARNNLALLLDKLGRTTEAIEQYKAVLRLDPSDPSYAEVHYNLGNALASLGQVPEAIEQFQAALRLKPDHAQALEKLTQLQARHK